MFRDLLQFLNQPYPDKSGSQSIFYNAGWTAFIVFFILFAFKPFGLQDAGGLAWLYCLGFAGVTVVATVIYELLGILFLKIRKDSPRWTLGWWLLYALGLMSFIAIGNYGFIVVANNAPLSWEIIFSIWWHTLLVGIFPLFIFGSLHTINQLRANQTVAKSISPHPHELTDGKRIELPIQGANDGYTVSVSEVLFIESQQNYVHLHLKTSEGLRKETLRTTLSSVEKALRETPVMRSHRSFLVNLDAVAQASGNAQGLTLHLDTDEGLTVPVSRKYIPEFRRLMGEYSA